MIAAPDVLAAPLLIFAAVGLAGFSAPGFMESVNEHGIQRWPMALIAALLAASAVLCRILGAGLVPSRFFGVFLATGAACMARPGFEELTGFYPPLEVFLAPLALLAAVAAVKLPTSMAIRLALAAFVVGAAFPYVADLHWRAFGDRLLESMVWAVLIVPTIMGAVAVASSRKRGRLDESEQRRSDGPISGGS